MFDAPAYSPAQVADRFAVGVHVVLAWIKSGNLLAINVASANRQRPRWRITAEAVEIFEARHAARPISPKQHRQRARPDSRVIQFV